VLRRLLSLFAASLTAASAQLWAEPAVTHLSASQSTYLQRCGGCHGIQGVSNPTVVPTLRGQVGQFLCTQAGRGYLLRLPSIATSPLSDQQAADLMNFVVFSLGGAQPDAVRAPRFGSREVHELRRKPLNEVALVKYRSAVVEALIQRCGASPALRSYGGVTPVSP
jgi:cytochrome c553